jgi:hypothetical protein
MVDTFLFNSILPKEGKFLYFDTFFRVQPLERGPALCGVAANPSDSGKHSAQNSQTNTHSYTFTITHTHTHTHTHTQAALKQGDPTADLLGKTIEVNTFTYRTIMNNMHLNELKSPNRTQADTFTHALTHSYTRGNYQV